MANLGNSIFVVAIDFGTTYSGYAFASRPDVESDPPKINTNIWQGSTLLSLKAPTAVLLDENKELVSLFRFSILLIDILTNSNKGVGYQRCTWLVIFTGL
jgi:hypothetical protein